MNRKPLEKSVQNDCVTRLEKRGAYVYRAMGNAMAGKGTADVLCCVKGRFVAIEFKREHNGRYGLTGAQRVRMRQVMAAGGLAFVVSSVDEVDVIIDDLDTVVPCEDWDCRRPVRSVSHASLHGYCPECASRNKDVMSSAVVREVLARQQAGISVKGIIAGVEAVLGVTITREDIERIESFDQGTTFNVPSARVNGVGIEIGVGNG